MQHLLPVLEDLTHRNLRVLLVGSEHLDVPSAHKVLAAFGVSIEMLGRQTHLTEYSECLPEIFQIYQKFRRTYCKKPSDLKQFLPVLIRYIIYTDETMNPQLKKHWIEKPMIHEHDWHIYDCECFEPPEKVERERQLRVQKARAARLQRIKEEKCFETGPEKKFDDSLDAGAAAATQAQTEVNPEDEGKKKIFEV